MKFEEILKKLISEQEEREFTDGDFILFKYNMKLYYRGLNQIKRDAINLEQQLSILASGWWEANWKILKKETKEGRAKKLTVAIADVFVKKASPRQLEKAKGLIEKELNTQSQ